MLYKCFVFAGMTSRLKIYHPTLHFTSLVTGPAYLCAISTPRGAYSPAAILVLATYRKHCHIYPTRYSSTPKWIVERDGEVHCTASSRCPNVERRET